MGFLLWVALGRDCRSRELFDNVLIFIYIYYIIRRPTLRIISPIHNPPPAHDLYSGDKYTQWQCCTQKWRRRRNRRNRRRRPRRHQRGNPRHQPGPSSNCRRKMRAAYAAFFSAPGDRRLLRRRWKTLYLKSRNPRGSERFTRSSHAMVLKMTKSNLRSPLSRLASEIGVY